MVADIDDRHLEKAGEVGADILLHPGRDKITDSIRKETGGGGADVVMDLVGLPETLERGLEWLRPAGKLLMVGYNLTRPFSWSSYDIVSKGLQIIGVRASTRRHLAEVIRWAQEKKIVPIVEDRLPLQEVNQVYDRLRSGKIIGRIVLEP
jgi:D-arabinose 1-dehydrogenase-like Zn-dependent alcohol dehydrogenase